MEHHAIRNNVGTAPRAGGHHAALGASSRVGRLGVILSSVLALAACDRAAFDSAAWRDADLATRERAEMASVLVASGRLDGLDRSGVVALLGAPTVTDKFRNSELIYVVGPEAGLVAMDHQWLLIELDRSGRVSGYRIVED